MEEWAGWKARPAAHFQTFADKKAMDDWGQAHYAAWGQALTTAERDAVAYYTGNNFLHWNKFLRGAGASRPEYARHGPPLDRALDAHPAPDAFVAWRGMDIGFLGIRRDQLRPGMDIPDAAYTSTTLDKGRVFGGELFEVRIPKGTPGAWLNRAGRASNNPGEREFLLSREVDRMRVVEVLPDRVVVEPVFKKGSP